MNIILQKKVPKILNARNAMYCFQNINVLFYCICKLFIFVNFVFFKVLMMNVNFGRDFRCVFITFVLKVNFTTWIKHLLNLLTIFSPRKKAYLRTVIFINGYFALFFTRTLDAGGSKRGR